MNLPRWLPPGRPEDLAEGTDDPYRLDRFVSAQEGCYWRARAEIRMGRKLTHWMWFIFPQAAGLGRSSTSEFYGIASEAEAAEYLRHPILGARLRECCEALLEVEGPTAHQIFGSPDDLKLRSSLTLFAGLQPEGSIFSQVLDKYFAGRRDPRTLEIMGWPENDPR